MQQLIYGPFLMATKISRVNFFSEVANLEYLHDFYLHKDKMFAILRLTFTFF